MNHVRTAHAAAREFAIDALGSDGDAVLIVDWATVALLVCLAGYSLMRTCRQGVDLVQDYGHLFVAIVELVRTAATTVERTWRRLFVALLCALGAVILFRLAWLSYQTIDGRDGRTPIDVFETARASAEAAVDAVRADVARNPPPVTNTSRSIVDTVRSWFVV